MPCGAWFVGLCFGVAGLLLGAAPVMAHTGGSSDSCAARSASSDSVVSACEGGLGDRPAVVVRRVDAGAVRVSAVGEGLQGVEPVVAVGVSGGGEQARTEGRLEEAPADQRRRHSPLVAGCADGESVAVTVGGSAIVTLDAGRPAGGGVVEEPAAGLSGVVGVTSVRIGFAPGNTSPPVHGPRVSAVGERPGLVWGGSGGFGGAITDGGGLWSFVGDDGVDSLLEGLTPAEAAHRRAQLRFGAAGAGVLADSAADRSFRRAQILFYNAGVSPERRVVVGHAGVPAHNGVVRHPAFSRPSSWRGGAGVHMQPKAQQRRPAYWSGTTPIYR